MGHFYSIRATFNYFSINVGGIVSPYIINYYVLSPLSLSTFGFLYNYTDVWSNEDNIQQVTWTNDSCDLQCD